MTVSPAYEFLRDLLIEIDGWGRVAREQWLEDAGIGHLKAYLPPDLSPLSFAPAILEASFQQGNDQSLRLLATALQKVVEGHNNHLHKIRTLLTEPDLIKFVFPQGRVAWAEDRATTLALAKHLFTHLPNDKVSLHVSPPDVPFASTSHMPFVANPNFVGREAEMIAIAEGIKTGQRAVVVAGIGGVGKTQLTVEWVYRYGRYFSGGVFWLDFSNEVSISLTIASAGLAYKYPYYAQMEITDQVRWVREKWKAEIPTLLIFDNCENPKLADEYAPIGSGARVLVTSRDQTIVQTIRAGGLYQINIETVTRLDSMKLLQRLRPNLSNDDAYAIAEELGDLPLALHIAGSFLQKYRDTLYGNPTTYLNRLKQPNLLEQLSEQSIRLPELPTKHERDVARTFLISIERLRLETQDNPVPSRVLLSLIVQFAPGLALPTIWLYKGLPEINDLSIVESINHLLAVGLVDIPRENSIRIHRLIAETVMQTLSTNEIGNDLSIRLGEVIIIKMQPQYGQPEFMPYIEEWLPHARHIAHRILLHNGELPIFLGSYLSSSLEQIGMYAEAQEWLQKSLEKNKTSPALSRLDSAKDLDALGLLHKRQGNYTQALLLYKEALDIYIDQVGLYHSSTAQVINNIAKLFESQGLHNLAENWYMQALDIRISVSGKRHPDTAHSLNDLAGLNASLKNYDKASKLYKEAISIFRENFGDRHSYVAISINDIALLYYTEKKYDLALPLYKESLSIFQETSGDRHPYTAATLSNIAILLNAQKLYYQAIPFYEESISIYIERLGINHPTTTSNIKQRDKCLEQINRFKNPNLITEISSELWGRIRGFFSF